MLYDIHFSTVTKDPANKTSSYSQLKGMNHIWLDFKVSLLCFSAQILSRLQINERSLVSFLRRTGEI